MKVVVTTIKWTAAIPRETVIVALVVVCMTGFSVTVLVDNCESVVVTKVAVTCATLSVLVVEVLVVVETVCIAVEVAAKLFVFVEREGLSVWTVLVTLEVDVTVVKAMTLMEQVTTEGYITASMT